MDPRFLLFLVVLGTSWCCNARVVTTNLSPERDAIASAALQINHQQFERNPQGVCTLCKEIITPVLEYLSNTTNQTELIAALHLFCALTLIYKDECNTFVDCYVPLIFNASSALTPETFCVQVGLCEIAVFKSRNLPENGCEFCHHAVTEASLKLKHSYFEQKIVELLLEACNVVEGSVLNYCKRLVLAKAPLIPFYAKQLLERQDICTLLNACDSITNGAKQASGSETPMLSAY